MLRKFLYVAGGALLFAGLLGFFPNPIVGDGGVFHTDVAHNLVHILTGLLSLVFAGMSVDAGKGFCKLFGVVYLIVALFGFFASSQAEIVSILNIFDANMADHLLHVVVAAVYLKFGLCKCK